MAQQTFEHKRIVQVSKELDAERDKYAKLTRDSNFLNARLKEALEEIEQGKEKLIQYQINNHRLAQTLKELERESQRLKDDMDKQKKKRSESEVENVRQRQKIDDLKQEMEDYENKTKALLYERTQEMAVKDKDIYRLKEQNIEVEKIYLDQRQKLQKREEKHIRDLAKLFQDFQALRKDINNFKTHTQYDVQKQQSKHKEELTQVLDYIHKLEARIRKQEQMQAEIDELKGRLEEVVSENSQKIIELYKYKYGK